jgi:two-component system, LytTR family, sensor histidine kinase AlgZ
MLTQFPLPKLQIPYLCHGRLFVRALVLSQACAVVLAFAPGSQSYDVWQRMGVISVFVHWVTLLTILCLCAVRKKINRLSPILVLVHATIIFMIITAGISLLSYAWLGSLISVFSHSLSTFVLGNLMVAFIIALVAIQFFIMHTERNEQVAAQGRAELGALQARIQPHFLFNSLNTVAELTQVDAKSAEKALLDLSALFRSALHAGEMVMLKDELHLAEQYLSLEQWRLGNRMQVNWDINQSIADILIPSLTIQPLLENAVRYGIESSSAKSVLSITYTESRQAISLVVTNPYRHADGRLGGNGIALNNIRQRLKLQYDDRASLTLGVVDDVFRAKLVIPKTD